MRISGPSAFARLNLEAGLSLRPSVPGSDQGESGVGDLGRRLTLRRGRGADALATRAQRVNSALVRSFRKLDGKNPPDRAFTTLRSTEAINDRASSARISATTLIFKAN